jgi:hypothetical protein
MNCRNAFSAVARVTGLAAVAIENDWPAWVMHQAPRPATSISPADPSALTIARPLPGANPAAVSKSVNPHRNRSRSLRNVVRTRSVGYSLIVPFASIRIWFQHRPVRPALATISLLSVPRLTVW